jgi:hypothetical protein
MSAEACGVIDHQAQLPREEVPPNEVVCIQNPRQGLLGHTPIFVVGIFHNPPILNHMSLCLAPPYQRAHRSLTRLSPQQG